LKISIFFLKKTIGVVGVALAIYGWGKGDPKRLITPYDYDGFKNKFLRIDL